MNDKDNKDNMNIDSTDSLLDSLSDQTQKEIFQAWGDKEDKERRDPKEENKGGGEEIKKWVQEEKNILLQNKNSPQSFQHTPPLAQNKTPQKENKSSFEALMEQFKKEHPESFNGDTQITGDPTLHTPYYDRSTRKVSPPRKNTHGENLSQDLYNTSQSAGSNQASENPLEEDLGVHLSLPHDPEHFLTEMTTEGLLQDIENLQTLAKEAYGAAKYFLNLTMSPDTGNKESLLRSQLIENRKDNELDENEFEAWQRMQTPEYWWGYLTGILFISEVGLHISVEELERYADDMGANGEGEEVGKKK